MSRTKIRGHRVLAVLLTLSLVLLLDFGVRAAYRTFWKKKSPPVVTHRTAQAEYHHGLRPNMTVTDRIGGREYPFFSNSLAMRDREVRQVSLQKASPRILFIGDSFTEGVGLPWEQTFVGKVQTALTPAGVEVLNAGVNSYCPLLIRHRLRDLVERQGLELDRVVVLIDISDVLQELQYRETPDGSVEAIPYAPFEKQAAALDRANRVQDWLEQNVEDRFVLLGALSRNLRLWWRSNDSATLLWDRMGDWAWNWPDSKGPYRELIDRGLSSAAAQMGDLARHLKSRKIALTVVVYPWPQQLGSPFQPGEAERFWGEWARNQGVDFISLYPRFRELGPAAEVREKYYFRGDSHWNAVGHAEVAAALVGPFREQILPPKNPAAKD